jgi:phenylpyruvate tautomerase PptA (4-oxalocrotonate tautomerase family)
MDERNNAAASASEHEFQAKLLRLIELSKKPRLDIEQERNERDELLRYFRRNGYTSAEISKLTGGNLKEDTIKRIIKGVQIDDDSLKKRVAELIGDVVRADLGLDDVRTSVSIKNALPEDIGVGDVSSFLADAQQSLDVIGGVKGVLSMYREMKQLQLSFAQVKELLEYKGEIERAGVKVQHLQKISEVAKKYKKGDVSQLMDALSSFDSLESINEKVKKEKESLDEAIRKRGTAEKDAKIAIAEYAHLREAITICKEMIIKYGFTTASFNDMYELAKKCGSPTEVMNVLAQYGDLTGQIKSLSDQKTSLDSEVKSLQENASKLKAELEGIRQSITGLLKPVTNEITKAFTDAINNITTTYQDQLRALKGASEVYGERLGKSLALKDELEFAKVINLIIKYPLEARELPLDYAIILLDAVKKMLVAKRIEVKIKAREAGMDKSVPFEGMEFEVKDLVEGARRALETIVVRS